MDCLQLDIGNSAVKWRRLRDCELQGRGHDALPGFLEGIARGHVTAPDDVIVASVAGPEEERRLDAVVAKAWGLRPWYARTAARFRDLVNSYEDPGRLGADRWLAMVAARARTKARACVVDAGSALTLDLIAADGRHEGGYILPGLGLMQQALLRGTGRVRFEEPVEPALTPGRSTAEAVVHGAAIGLAGAVRFAVDLAGPPAPRLFYCGGGARGLSEAVALGGEVVEDLVLDGLALAAASR